MSQRKRWKVVLEAEEPPACGTWVAIGGMCPRQEEVACFLFLDGTEAKGFTVIEGTSPGRREPSFQEVLEAHAGGHVPWLHFQDCMMVVGAERLDWCPATWPHDRPLWLLVVKSLPSNAAFERRVAAGQERRIQTLRRRRTPDPPLARPGASPSAP